jgi:hypothetical protein
MHNLNRTYMPVIAIFCMSRSLLGCHMLDNGKENIYSAPILPQFYLCLCNTSICWYEEWNT